MACADCGDEIGSAAVRTCAGCARSVHVACWERAGGCGWFACPEARAYRRWVIGYLDKQLSADLAVVSWVPCFMAAGLIAGGAGGWLGAAGATACGALLAVLLVPVGAVMVRRSQLHGGAVAVRAILGFARQRHERAGSVLQRNRALVARLEDRVTNPILFASIALAGLASWQAGSLAGGAAVVALAHVASALYLGPSRRALENPVRDFPRWEQDVARALGEGARVRADGALAGSED